MRFVFRVRRRWIGTAILVGVSRTYLAMNAKRRGWASPALADRERLQGKATSPAAVKKNPPELVLKIASDEIPNCPEIFE
jgi:hypothetical protein